jgi:hypothetical protein
MLKRCLPRRVLPAAMAMLATCALSASAAGPTPGGTPAQQRIMKRSAEEAKTDVTRHLYVISPASGEVLMHSSVMGLVGSSSERLRPSRVETFQDSGGFSVPIGADKFHVSEVMNENGTYGTTMPFIYWWDTRGVYHQHFLTEGQIIHVCAEPLSAKPALIDLDKPAAAN